MSIPDSVLTHSATRQSGARNFSDRELRISHPGVPCQSARKSLYQRADLPGSLEGGAGGCKQCGVLYHQEYPPEAAEGYKERIYPDCVGSRIQVCRCPRGVISWDFFIYWKFLILDAFLFNSQEGIIIKDRRTKHEELYDDS